MVGFTSTDLNSRWKTTIPTAGTPNNMICWLWDDLNPNDINNTDDHVYVEASGGSFIVQFSVGDVITMQVILYPDGTIKLQYLSIAAGFDTESGTIGIENGDGTDGLRLLPVTCTIVWLSSLPSRLNGWLLTSS
jgi:hypothetical protein